MAREKGALNVTVWQDNDWRALPFPAQHLYLLMWTHPELSYCGVVDYRPGRLAALSGWLSADLVELSAQCLEARHFVVVDRDSEEALIRSWLRWDGVMKQPRLPVSMAKAYASTASNRIRGVVVNELHKLQRAQPELACWSHEKVRDVLGQPRVDIKTEPPSNDPFAEGLERRFVDALQAAATAATASVSRNATTTATTKGFDETLPAATRTRTPSPATATSTSLPANQGASDDAPGRFEEFWKAYPSRGPHANPKKPAKEKFNRITKNVDPQVLIDAAGEYARTRARQDPRHTAQAITWLNQERWSDEVVAAGDADDALADEARELGIPRDWL